MQVNSLDDFSIDEVLAAVDASTRKSAAARKCDEVFDWVREHWKLFASTRSRIALAIEEADRSFGHTEDGLASALGLPANVFLVRGKAEDVKASELLNLKGSRLVEVFCNRQAEAGCSDVAVIYVAGRLSVVITSMQTAFPEGSTDIVYNHAGTDIRVFPAEQLNHRLPQIRRLGE